ncbi:Response regulator of citrate/malate metabolism [Limihaloglobus sulfuriphilus]|uniref:Response regulator of citrate/malate metabolism n=1 Tax=Limihaloglobus sulfuriphilus TaxID=1851148 RepID=A0A1Q2MGI3_9BACT|nr:response regulator [Limihaloglobus sulfuriphilus]AQQ71417.1 Response regulator of citrate/malate metabolism [Limihaloglobus sulfuriphilus]
MIEDKIVVLIVDDLEGQINTNTDLCELNDCEVITAQSLKEAKVKLDEHQETIDFAIVDYKLSNDPSNQDGALVISYINTRYPKIKTIFITAYDDEVALHEFYACKATKYVNKMDGAAPEMLDECIQELIRMIK